jgi:hypothetical protein
MGACSLGQGRTLHADAKPLDQTAPEERRALEILRDVDRYAVAADARVKAACLEDWTR